MHDYELCNKHYPLMDEEDYVPSCTLEQGHDGPHEDHGQVHLGMIHVWEEVTE